jgi:hypothetical protein
MYILIKVEIKMNIGFKVLFQFLEEKCRRLHVPTPSMLNLTSEVDREQRLSVMELGMTVYRHFELLLHSKHKCILSLTFEAGNDP